MHACKPDPSKTRFYVTAPTISTYPKYSTALRILDQNLHDYSSSPICYIPHLANSPKYDNYNNIPNTIPLCDLLNHTIQATIASDFS
jgi:hypothetical protein